MKLITFIIHFHELKPTYKNDMVIAIRWGMWLGGIIVFFIFLTLRLFKII